MTFFYRKIFLQVIVLVGLISINVTAQHTKTPVKKTALPGKKSTYWNVSPFDSKLFIENKGQFDVGDITKDKVVYSASLGNVKLYFTNKGIVYTYDEYKKDPPDQFQKPTTYTLTTQWVNSSPAVTITAEQELSYSYHYPSGRNGTIIASIYRKIIYHNLYPGIDIEYYFPENKEGFEYDIIAHPGADISQVRLAYDNVNPKINALDNVSVNTEVGEITDHAPVCAYADGGAINVKYVLDGNAEGFKLAAYDKSKTIIIDPWTTNPKFTGAYNKAYDLDYDVNGNVYVYGGYSPFQLVKLSNTGVIQWAFPASNIDGNVYGGIAVDPKSGTSYLIEGARASGARILKVNSAGTLQATSAGDANMNEMWRPVFNTCNDNIVIGA
ncbi:MAG TPA: hypothetical protein VK783_07745, partial [Bacteroidia bacterium]|nr:hypothetical protein [Bacteroidia bacterium]